MESFEYCQEISKKTKRRRCTETGCTKGALQGSADKCSAHGGGKRCTQTGCTKGALGSADKCSAHGGGKRCTETGCTKSALGSTGKCSSHGGGQRCTQTGCTKSALGLTGKCSSHGGGQRCTQTGCTKGALGLTGKCSSHGGGKRCTEIGCTKSAQGSTDKCAAHGGGNRCPNCIDWIDSRSSSHNYDGYCATCFKRLFPDDDRSKKVYAHTKELLVRNTINDHFKGFTHDRALYTGNCDCTHRRRVDHRKLIGNTVLAIETDEFGHIHYDKYDEEIRYDDLYMIHSGKWIFIRFNPDSNIDTTDIEDKLNKLIETIDQCIYRIENEENEELLEIIKLYC